MVLLTKLLDKYLVDFTKKNFIESKFFHRVHWHCDTALQCVIWQKIRDSIVFTKGISKRCEYSVENTEITFLDSVNSVEIAAI